LTFDFILSFIVLSSARPPKVMRKEVVTVGGFSTTGVFASAAFLHTHSFEIDIKKLRFLRQFQVSDCYDASILLSRSYLLVITKNKLMITSN